MNGSRKSNRREFLKGKAAADAVGDLAAGLHCTGSLSSPQSAPGRTCDGGTYLIQVGRKAMACRFQVFLNAGQHEGAVEAAVEALDVVEALEEQLSVFRPHSEISRLNREGAERAVRLESRLFQLLERCIELNRATGGAFDITAAPLVKLWGFHNRQGRFPSEDEIRETLERVGSCWLEPNAAERTVRFRRPGVEVNLGSIGKGYALDRAADRLEEAGIENFMIHGGQSSILARGARLSGHDEPGWSIALRHPLRPEQRLAEITVCDAAIGTSGTGRQFFYHRGRRYGHILDPRTGRPAEGVLSVTVSAPTAEQADALATAFFVMGVEAAGEFCRSRADIAALFVCPGDRQGSVKLETVGSEDRLPLRENRRTTLDERSASRPRKQ